MSRNAIEALLEYLKAIVKDYGDCDEDWYDIKMVSWGYHSLTLGELYQCIQKLEVMDADRQEARLYKDQADYWHNEWMKQVATHVDDALIKLAIAQRDEARRWARRLYQVAKQAREAILDLGRRTCYAYEYKESNWRGYLGVDMLDAYDALCKALGEEE